MGLLSTLQTRRYVLPLLRHAHLTARLRRSRWHAGDGADARLFRRLVRTLDGAVHFPLDHVTGRSLPPEEVAAGRHGRVRLLQKLCHMAAPDAARELVLAGAGRVCRPAVLRKLLGGLDVDGLRDLCAALRLLPDKKEEESILSGPYGDRSFLLDVLVEHHCLPPNAALASNLPSYPTEALLWDGSSIPPSGSRRPLFGLPRLGLQFLSCADMLLRSHQLYRLESAADIRRDVADAVRRVDPVIRERDDGTTGTAFRGWSRMALEVGALAISHVAEPRLGEGDVPASVTAEIKLDTKAMGDALRREWDAGLREHENLFLVAVDAALAMGAPADGAPEGRRRVPDEEDLRFPARFGLVAVRGCAVLELRDQAGDLLNDPAARHDGRGYDDKKAEPGVTRRKVRVALDPAQFRADVEAMGESRAVAMYGRLNLVVRRKGKENNFKAVLDTVRDLTRDAGTLVRSVPTWLQPVLLGYGDPASAHRASATVFDFALNTAGVTRPDAFLDFGDTFLDRAHLEASFGADTQVEVKSAVEGEEVQEGACAPPPASCVPCFFFRCLTSPAALLSCRNPVQLPSEDYGRGRPGPEGGGRRLPLFHRHCRKFGQIYSGAGGGSPVRSVPRPHPGRRPAGDRKDGRGRPGTYHPTPIVVRDVLLY